MPVPESFATDSVEKLRRFESDDPRDERRFSDGGCAQIAGASPHTIKTVSAPAHKDKPIGTLFVTVTHDAEREPDIRFESKAEFPEAPPGAVMSPGDCPPQSLPSRCRELLDKTMTGVRLTPWENRGFGDFSDSFGIRGVNSTGGGSARGSCTTGGEANSRESRDSEKIGFPQEFDGKS